MTTQAIYDKHGREIKYGDVLKVYHFTAALRRQKHYMYKQVREIHTLGNNPFLKISHLNMDDSDYYDQFMDGSILKDYEIVQGMVDDFEDRPKHAPHKPEENV